MASFFIMAQVLTAEKSGIRMANFRQEQELQYSKLKAIFRLLVLLIIYLIFLH